MFYEESKIEALLKCASCNEKFDEPRNLPCGNTVCSACLETIVKTTDKRDNSFKCSMCKGSHKNAEFPVNLIVKSLMETMPDEVFRSDLVEKFKANLNEIDRKKVDLEKHLTNGANQVREHCIELRLDVDLATETAIAEIQGHREIILKQINDYEARTVGLIETEVKTRDKF